MNLFLPRFTQLLFILLFTTANSPFAAVISDDFHSNNIDTSLWSIVDPQADSTFSMDSSRLSIQIPGGISHDVWDTGNFAPRLMQVVTDTDFELIAKFESIPANQYQIQGILVEGNATNFIRFDVYSDGSNTYLFTADFVDGTPQVIANISATLTTPYYLKVSRSLGSWNYSYSTDNITWNPVTTFNRSMVVTSVGLFAGNSGTTPPPFTALVDYFFDPAAPIDPEDSGVITDVIPPYLYNQNFSTTDNSILTFFSTDEPSAVTVHYGTTNSYELGSVAVAGYLLNHSIVVPGLSASTNYHFKIVAQDSAGNIYQSPDQQITTLAPGAGSGPVIDIWYGDNQSFGQLGVPQRWVNVLGNVNDPDGINSLQYSLNGASYLPLSIGPDNLRLNNYGDFNVEIDYTLLVSGSNTVDIIAEDNVGNISIKTVNLTFNAGNSWPLPYSIDWSSTNNIHDVAQVVDGKWSIQGSTVRTMEIGYDRLIAVGDLYGWHDYEITVPVTINAVDPDANRPGIGLLLRWPGHYAWDTNQPSWGWWPMGSLGWYRYEASGPGTDQLRMLGGDGSIIDADNSGKKLSIGITYLYKMRVETPVGQGSWYRLKVWEQGNPEPASWDLEAQESTADVQFGSLLLLAHHVDASFGAVNVTPIGDAPVDTPPVISNISVNANETVATISWTTDKPADSVIDYALDTNYGNTVSDSLLTTSHSITLSGLTADTLYHFQISATDSTALTGFSTDQTFTTTASASGAIITDAFVGPSLDPVWSIVDPLGDGTVSTNGSQLVIDVPAGAAHDVWSSGNDSVRISQAANNVDFETELKFDSTPNSQYQIQGLLVEQDASNFIRFDFFHDGTNLKIFAASFVNGIPTAQGNFVISNGQPLYMRVKRAGNTWTQSYSYDGLAWYNAASFSHTINVTGLSIFGGNAGNPTPAFQVLVDHFLMAEGTLPVVDLIAPTISNVQVSPNGTEATITWQTSEPASTTVDYGLTAAYGLGQINNANLLSNHSALLSGLTVGSLYHFQITTSDAAGNVSTSGDITFTAEIPQPPIITNIAVSASASQATITWTTDKPADSVIDFGVDTTYGSVVNDPLLTTSHSLTLSGLAAETLYHFQISATDSGTLTGTSADQTFTTTAASGPTISEAFDGPSLDPSWSIVDPLGDGTVSTNGTHLVVDVPAGTTHDVWSSSNDSVRISRAVNNVDFETELKFDSTPISKYQIQGLLVEQDANNFIRFDFYHDGIDLKVFAASFVNGVPTAQSNMVIISGQPLYMRVKRVGDVWTQNYSYNGVAWFTAASFSHAMNVAGLSIFAGNAGNPTPAFQVLVDHFLMAEGTLPVADLIAPTISNILVSTNGSEATITWQTDEPATSTLDYGLTPAYEIGQVNNANLLSNHSVVLTGLTIGSLYHMQITVDDAAANTATSADITFTAEVPQPPVITNVAVAATDTQATITWTTDKPADSVINYGLDATYGNVVSDPVLTTSHSLTLSGLTAGTLYHFQISATDSGSLTGTSTDQTFTTTLTSGPLISDAFDSPSLDPSWSIVDPLGDGTVSSNGTQLVIDVPAGTSHDVWSNGNDSVRISQAVNNVDFDAELKFDSTPNSKYQIQGLLVEQDANNFIRFDFYHDGTNLRIFAASFVNGVPTVQGNFVISSSQPLYLRVNRVGNTWTQSYSYDGVTWYDTASFSHTISVTGLSIFAGNAGTNPPAFQALVDYIIVTNN